MVEVNGEVDAELSYKFTKWMILIVPTLIVGLWEYVRHQFLMPFISMDLGNVLTPVILFAVSITLLNRWFSYLEQMQEELQRERALKAKLEQREQLARELHDGIAQSLFLLSVKVDRAQRQRSADSGDEEWHELRTAIHKVNRYVREAISDLRVPADVKEEGAASTSMSARIRQMAAEQQLVLHIDWQLNEDEWSTKARMELLSCIREAFINVGKHAGVSEVSIAATGNAEFFNTVITDYGSGFVVQEAAEPGRYGLQIMRERASGMGWTLQVTSRPGATTLQITGGVEV